MTYLGKKANSVLQLWLPNVTFRKAALNVVSVSLKSHLPSGQIALARPERFCPECQKMAHDP